MDFGKQWTAFALEAETDAYGFTRIAEAHNKIAGLRAELIAAVRAFVALDDGDRQYWWHGKPEEASKVARALLERIGEAT